MDILYMCKYIFIVVYECINIEYDNKINFVFNVYTYYFKTKPRTLLELLYTDNKINFVFNVYTYYFKTKPRTLLELLYTFLDPYTLWV